MSERRRLVIEVPVEVGINPNEIEKRVREAFSDYRNALVDVDSGHTGIWDWRLVEGEPETAVPVEYEPSVIYHLTHDAPRFSSGPGIGRAMCGIERPVGTTHNATRCQCVPCLQAEILRLNERTESERCRGPVVHLATNNAHLSDHWCERCEQGDTATHAITNATCADCLALALADARKDVEFHRARAVQVSAPTLDLATIREAHEESIKALQNFHEAYYQTMLSREQLRKAEDREEAARTTYREAREAFRALLGGEE